MIAAWDYILFCALTTGISVLLARAYVALRHGLWCLWGTLRLQRSRYSPAKLAVRCAYVLFKGDDT